MSSSVFVLEEVASPSSQVIVGLFSTLTAAKERVPSVEEWVEDGGGWLGRSDDVDFLIWPYELDAGSN